MNISNVKAIIWDLDGTLLDSFRIFITVLQEIAEEHGHTLQDEDFLTKNYHGELTDTIKKDLDIKSDEELVKAVDAFLSKQDVQYSGDVNAHLFNDALKLAQQAASKNLPQLLITNRDHKGRKRASPRAIVESTLLADCITEIRCGDEVEFRKPDKRAVASWLEEEGIHPDHALVVGDQFVDGQLATNLGSRVLLVDRNGGIPHIEELGEELGDHIYVVKDLHNVVLV